MREDAKNLLDRLGASALDYRDFPNRFAEYEYWPLFGAMLADPDVRERLGATTEIARPGTQDARAIQQHLFALSQAGGF
jgi:hypothetical protein